MADLEPIIEWPGLETIISAEGTLAHGVGANAWIIQCKPQKKMPPILGTLTLRWGDYKQEFKECRIRDASYTFNERGEIVSLIIDDRRWKWRYGHISGIYNVRLQDGEILQRNKGSKLAVLDTEREPQELAKLLLEEMQEQGYDVGDLPNAFRPSCEWDYVNPAMALQELCEQVGTRVVLQTTGKVKICKTGQGTQLSDQYPYESYGQAMELAQLPENMLVIGDRVLWQVDIPLEAVGMERDETIKLLDDLSYKPSSGWGNLQTHGGISNVDDREMARRTVFKMYRIKSPVTLPLTPPGVNKTITQLDLILPLVGTRGEYKIDADTKKKILYPPVCYGNHYFKHDAELANRMAADPKPGTADISQQIVQAGFSLNEEKGIVSFGDHVFKRDNGKPVPADIYLRCCVGLRSEKTGQFYRYERRKKVGKTNAGEPDMVLRHPEISVLVKRDKTSNQAKKEKEADYYIDAMVKELVEKKPQVAEYKGWYPIELDGAIHSISWSMGPDGARMVVQRNDDSGSSTTLPYNQRLNKEKLKPQTRIELKGGVWRTIQMDRGWNE
jgi:hypothetical protein